MAPLRPGPRGWSGPGRGRDAHIAAPAQWRATSNQLCGLWPFVVGTGVPSIGAPLGRHLSTGSAVCADPISWFMRGNLISNPSMFALGLPGLGKSTAIRQMLLGVMGFGGTPLVLGDLKPDYVDLVDACGGQVIHVGRGRDYLNILDPGEIATTAHLLSPSRRAELLLDAHSRKVALFSALFAIVQRRPMTVIESNIIGSAIMLLADRAPRADLRDLHRLIREAPEELRLAAVDRGAEGYYASETRNMEAVLLAMQSPTGPIGDCFSRQTTKPMDRDRPVVFDCSAISSIEEDLRAAAMLTCWSTGFAAVNVHHALADEGREPRRHHFVVMDELWRALRGSGIVDQIDSLSRLNRTEGVGQASISHTMKDLEALPEEDQKKAAGLVERSGFVLLGGLPAGEIPLLERAGIRLSRREADLITSWSAPATFDSRRNTRGAPPGRGNFLIKIGSRPGIPIHIPITTANEAVSNTNKRWGQ